MLMKCLSGLGSPKGGKPPSNSEEKLREREGEGEGGIRNETSVELRRLVAD